MRKRIAALLLAGVVGATLLTGCGGLDKKAIIAGTDDMEVSLGIANFYCRYQQASVEDLYKVYFGDNVWTQDLYGNGTTMLDSMKDSVMSTLHDLYTLKLHMGEYGVGLTADEKKAITDAAEAFMNNNSKAAIKEMGATQDIVEEFLTLVTIQNKMKDAIDAKADTNVSDKEANMRGYTQIMIATDSHTDEEGNSIAYTDEEVAELKAKAEAMVTALAEEGATLESVAQANGYETSTDTYATYELEVTEEDDPLLAALEGLKVGETSSLVDTDRALYIVRVDNDTDKEATEKNRESIIETRKNEFYSETLDGWQKDDGWFVDDEELARIQFENSLTVKAPES